MKRPLFVLFLSSVVALACSSNPNDTASRPTCTLYDPGASFNFNAPVVSLKNDVVPIFKQSCAFGTCHGRTSSASNNGIYIGTDTALFIKGSVGVEAGEISTMKFVAKGDAKNSFLMHKIDGDLCALADQCLGKDCRDQMPRGSSALETNQRDTIRRWIQQGAADN